MSHHHMIHDTLNKREDTNSRDVSENDTILHSNSTSHVVETLKSIKEEVTEEVTEEVEEEVVHRREKIFEGFEHKTFSSSDSSKKQVVLEDVKKTHGNNPSNIDRFLENTEIICTGTKDHCFIVINSDYNQNKVPFSHFWSKKGQSKIYDVNFNKQISNLEKHLNCTETETYDFYEDITMFNSPSYRQTIIDKISAELIKGKICKIREENNRRHTGVIKLNGFEFFPLDSNADDDLTETQFYASIRQKIIDKNIQDHELDEYFNIIRKEIDSNVRLYEKKTKYTEYLYKFMKKYETKKKNSQTNALKEKMSKEMDKKIDITNESMNAEVFEEDVKTDDFEYINYDEINDCSDNSNVLTNIHDEKVEHSLNDVEENVDRHLRNDKVHENLITHSDNKLEEQTIENYDIIEETLTLSSETTPSISPDQKNKYYIESKNNDFYGKENDSKLLLSQSSSFILNESDLSDMSSFDEKEIDSVNGKKVVENEKIFDKNECENFYPKSKEVVSNTIEEIVHKTIPQEGYIDDSDKCIQEKEIWNENVNEYKNVTYTNVYSIDSHSNQIDFKSNIFSNIESDYQLSSPVTQSLHSSVMDNSMDDDIDDNKIIENIHTNNVPLIEKDITNNFEIDDKNVQTNNEIFNFKFEESIDNISTNLINEAIKESVLNSTNDDFYSPTFECANHNEINKIENHTSMYITEENYYTTTVKKINKNEEDDKYNHMNDNENEYKIIDTMIENDKLEDEIKSTNYIDNSDDKNIYYDNDKIFLSNDSNNNTNIDIELIKRNSNCSSNSEIQGNIKDSDDFIYINDDKYKIIEKTTVIREYFKIKDESDIQKHSKKYLKNIDMNKDLSINRRSKFNSPCKHERSKSTNSIINESRKNSDLSFEEGKHEYRRYRSSSQSHLTKEDYLLNSHYIKKNLINNNGKSIYRSSGSLTIIDNHIYKKLSSEDVQDKEIKKESIKNEDIEGEKFIYDNNEKNIYKINKFGYEIKSNTYTFKDNVKTNAIHREEEWIGDYKKQQDNNLKNKNNGEDKILQSEDLLGYKQQIKKGREKIIYTDSEMVKKNIYEDIDVNINSKSNDDDFPYVLENEIPIKSEEIIKMNRLLSKYHHFDDVNYDESTIKKTLEYRKIDNNQNKHTPPYLHEPIFSKIMGNKIECKIVEQENKNINNCTFIQDKPLAVPLTYENWDYDSCFSDEHSSVNHDFYMNKNKIHDDASTIHSASPAISFDKERLAEKKVNNSRCDDYSSSETISLPMFKKTTEIDMNCQNNYLEKNLPIVCQQHMEELRNKKENKNLLDTTLIAHHKSSSDLKEQKVIKKVDGKLKCLSLKKKDDEKMEKSARKLNFNKRSEIPLNCTTTNKNIHNTNIFEKNISDSNETSLVDIVKKVKEQNGIYKYNETKRKTYLYKEETQNFEDSPSQKDYKSVFGSLKKSSDKNCDYLNSKYSKNYCKEDTLSSEDFRNSPIFNKIQNSNKNRFENLRVDKFDKHLISTSYSHQSSDFGEPLYHSSFNHHSQANSFKIKFEKPIPLINSTFLKQMMTNTRDSSPSSISSEHCNQIINIDENSVLHHWDPEKLINQLYKIDYEPRKESKRNHFINMEGHLEVPNTDTNIIPELEKTWKRRYFKTKEGRLTWYATHYADENPEGDILLSGTDIECDKNEGTFYIHGGMEHAKVKVRVPREPEGLFDKWRRALLSHSSSSILDAYVQPIAKKIPHSTEKVVILDLGSCSIRGGVLTREPSLPQSFFPAIGVFRNDGSVVVGCEALKPENRHNGVLHQPIPNTDPAIEKYKINKVILKACIDKVISDLKIDPSKYKILLSLPQNIPPTLLGDILKLLLDKGYFNGVSITRQPSLILYSYDVTTGVVVDIGERLNIVPVIDGYIVDNAVINLPYGALQIEDCLRVKLNETNEGFYSFQGPVERMILRYLMEQACYISNDYDKEVQNCNDNDNIEVSLEEYNPTQNMKTKFSVNASRFIATEGLFKPNRWGIEGKGLHQLINDVIQLSPIDSRRTLYKNIYLSGGISLLPNLAERLENEIMKLVPPTIHIQVHTSPWRYHAAYLGAQVLASSCTFDSSCVSNNQLNDFVNQLKNSAF